MTGITVTFSDWSRAESVLIMILGTDWIFESYFQTLDLTFDIIIILMVGTENNKLAAKLKRDFDSFSGQTV